jgi:hypothetical protein
MASQLRDEDYEAPGEVPFVEPEQRADYLMGHRAGWLAFVNNAQTTLTEDGYQRGSLPGLSTVRPKDGSPAGLAGFDAGFHAANALNLERVLQATAHAQAPGEWESPVGQPDRLDMIVTRNDGTVAVIVVAARALDPDDRRTADVLEAKLRNYCRYINHPAFAAEFGAPNRDRVKLVIRCDWEVPEQYIQLLVRVANEEEVRAGLEIRYE